MSNETTSRYHYGGVSDYGYMRDVNEDFLAFEALREDILLGVIADGAGSRQCGFEIQPASIATVEFVDTVKRMYSLNPQMLEEYPIEVLNEAVASANRAVGTFKIANEDLYSGFGVCMSACLIINDKFYIVHCGNTRIYLIRHMADKSAHIIQLTKDHTLAERMVDDGTLAADEYYHHPSRNTYTSGIGIFSSPEVQSYSGSFKKSDLLVLTTDGIHYAIRPKAISNIILEADGWEEAAKSLIQGAKMMKLVDNMTAAIIYNI